MLADVLPTPTLALDFLYLGPVGIAVGAVIFAAAILTGRALRRRGSGWGWRFWARVAVFVALDLVVFFAYFNVFREPYSRRHPEFERTGPVGQAP